MKGTVTIGLEDYMSLTKESDKAKELADKVKEASKELEVFLSFLCKRAEIDKVVSDFNLQSTQSRIEINDGRVKIRLRYNDSNKV